MKIILLQLLGNMCINVNTDAKEVEKEVPEEEMTETQKLMKQVKEAGTAGVIRRDGAPVGARIPAAKPADWRHTRRQ